VISLRGAVIRGTRRTPRTLVRLLLRRDRHAANRQPPPAPAQARRLTAAPLHHPKVT
jgi:hypothetical protein